VHDYVIVGAGAAGCVLAARLTEDPDVSVLLLEAGAKGRKLEIRIPAAFSRLYRSSVDWGYDTAPQPALDGREIVFPRGKALGGSTAINAMMVLRGHPADQAAWGVPGWGWDDVVPAYERSRGAFPLEPPRDRSPLTDAFLDASVAAGIARSADLNGADIEGAGLVPLSQQGGRRFSVADGYLRPAVRRPNLTVVTGCHVTRVLLERGAAVGVAYVADGGEEEAQAGREVILAAGAINTPQLLLLSGIGPREELERHGIDLVHDLPGVGRNLLDHLANGILVHTRDAETLYSAESLPNLLRWLVRGRGPLTSNVAEAVAFVRTDPDLEAPDLELLFAPVLFEEEGLKRPSAHGLTVASILLQPRSAGEVRLRSADPLDPPVIDPCYLSDPGGDDARLLLHGIRLARRIVATEPLARFVEAELLPGEEAQDDDALLAHVRQSSQTLYHPVGTCRLGLDDGAVVDPELRVRGIGRLRVIDASVIPRLPRGHTSWPTVMVAERGADLVASASTL
jgi:choline dehydrogenase